MQPTEKAISWRDEVAAELKIRLSALAQVKGFSATDQSPTLLVGAAAAGSDGFFMKIGAPASLWKDVLGLTQNSFTPHTIQICTEGDNTAGAGADVLTAATEMAMFGVLLNKGVRLEWYQVASGVAPTEAGITSGNLKASFENTLQYPGMASL